MVVVKMRVLGLLFRTNGVCVDEVGSFQSLHRIALIGKRADSFGAQAVRIYTSTVKKDGQMGNEDACLMLSLYEDSTQSRLYFACPHCGHWHPLEWGNVLYCDDDEAESAQTVRMLCPKCQKPIDENQRQKMLRNWRLVHQGQTVNADGEVIGTAPRTRRFGLLWTCLDSTLRDLPTLAIEHWRASQDLKRGEHGSMRSFYRDQLCQPYRDDLQIDEDTPSIPTRVPFSLVDHGKANLRLLSRVTMRMITSSTSATVSLG